MKIMKTADFQSSPLHANELPVASEADAFASPFPVAIPTVAPDALLCPTRVELDARWLGRPQFDAANRTWHQLLNHLAAFYPQPHLN